MPPLDAQHRLRRTDSESPPVAVVVGMDRRESMDSKVLGC